MLTHPAGAEAQHLTRAAASQVGGNADKGRATRPILALPARLFQLNAPHRTAFARVPLTTGLRRAREARCRSRSRSSPSGSTEAQLPRLPRDRVSARRLRARPEALVRTGERRTSVRSDDPTGLMAAGFWCGCTWTAGATSGASKRRRARRRHRPRPRPDAAINVYVSLTQLAPRQRAVLVMPLGPLRRVPGTARRVSERPLDRGEVALMQTVPEADTDPRTEVCKLVPRWCAVSGPAGSHPGRWCPGRGR